MHRHDVCGRSSSPTSALGRQSTVVTCFSGLLVLVACKEGTSDRLENVGGSSNIAGSAGASGEAGGSGAGGDGGTGGVPLDAGGGGSNAGADGSAPVPGRNLIADPGFEKGALGWLPVGPCTVSMVAGVSHTGSKSLFVSDRAETWTGAGYNITALVVPRTRYEVRAWLRLAESDGGPPPVPSANITTKRVCTGEQPTLGTFTAIASGAVGTDWVELRGTIETPTCELTELIFYFENMPPGVSYHVDDVSLAAEP